MELINATRMVAGYNLGLEPSGRESLVVVIKGTFRFPMEGEPAGHFALHQSQVPLVMSDTFTGEPGRSAPVHEIDFAPYKPRCDILLNASAYAPQGQPAQRVDVGVRIGDWHKAFSVVGARRWDCGIATLRTTAPEPLIVQPISYDVAYGGVDTRHDDPAQHEAFMANPVGLGFHKHSRREWVDGQPLPLTEEFGRPVTDINGDHRPMSFGPLGRGWTPRAALAGTYDDDWRERHFPFLPPDFDPRYYQSAPEDQQVRSDFFSRGPMDVTLSNLTPEGTTHLTIPHLVAPVHVFPKGRQREDYIARLDTVLIEPDLRRYSLTWRVARPLRKNMHEVAQVLVGKKGREWWQQRDAVTFPLPVVMVPVAKHRTV